MESDTDTSSTDVEAEDKPRRSGGFTFRRSFTVHTVSDSSDEEPIVLSISPSSSAKAPRPGGSSQAVLELSGSFGSSQTDPPEPSRPSGSSKTDPEPSRPSGSSRISSEGDRRPACRYGARCYRKNASHLQAFSHPSKGRPTEAAEESREGEPARPSIDFGLFLTRVPEQEKSPRPEISLREILAPSMGSLEASAQFSFMFEVDWMLAQYPEEFRSKPLLLVHASGISPTAGTQAARLSNIRSMQARLELQFGTHHTKMMLLRYKEGFRVVIHTANMIPKDWMQKTQGVWVSPRCPPLEQTGSALEVLGDSKSHFKRDLLQYLRAYRHGSLDAWVDSVIAHDFSAVRVHLIASSPGRFTGNARSSFGHLKLRQILSTRRLRSKYPPDFAQWPVIGQFSSIGSLGASPGQWVCGEWLESLGGPTSPRSRTPLLVYPTADNVRTSLEGYPAGASLPYQSKVAGKQPWLTKLLHSWKADVSKRTAASPHIKTYCRSSPGGHRLSWFLLTSANLSKAAWGALEKGGSQLMIRSYELGVLFLPELFDLDAFSTAVGAFPVPFDLPPTPYDKNDQPWILDLPYTQLPDRHGNMWVPS